MFAAMGLSAVYPVIHGVLLYGIERMDAISGMRWTVLQGILYLTGAALYAVSLTHKRCVKANLIVPAGTTSGKTMAWKL